MSDERLREAYERGLKPGVDRPPLDDVAAERLRRLVEREGSDDERLHTLDTLLSSREGRRELEIAWAAARAARPRRGIRPMWLAAASLVLVAGVGAIWVTTRPEERVERSEASPITLVAPLGAPREREAGRFVWRALGDAESYTLVVVDTTGTEVYAAQTRDTAVTLPDSVRLRPGVTYLWWVQARTAMGGSVTAVTQRVEVRR